MKYVVLVYERTAFIQLDTLLIHLNLLQIYAPISDISEEKVEEVNKLLSTS